MVKPNGYDEAKAAGSYVPVELGGHYAVIKQVAEKLSASGKPMIVVLFDFDKNDKQTGYFMNEFNSDVRDEKKWPFAGSKYIMTQDYRDPNKTNKDFKTFCSCVEHSNSGFNIGWGDNWGKQFVGKKIGVVYGMEETEYNGEIKTRPAVRWFCNVDAVSNASVPDLKKLRGANRPAQTQAPAQTFAPVDDDEDIPF